jgi:Icc-related predicted phosphoesterase
MKIFAISDTHGKHEQVVIPQGTDMLIHAGDFSNTKLPVMNSNEVNLFLIWLEQQPVKYKVIIAGNHDTSIESRLFTKKDFKDRGIIYLEHESIEIEGIKIFGSPYTPEYNNWAFNRSRNKLGRIWDSIPDDTDILITHGPPKGILDSASRDKNNHEHAGCSALLKRALKIQPKLHIFGHLHDNEDNLNNGTFKLLNYRTIFANVSCVKDGDKLPFTYNGFSFEMDDNHKIIF